MTSCRTAGFARDQTDAAAGARAWMSVATANLVAAAWRRGVGFLVLPMIWQERYRARRMLLELTDRQLQDVGLSRDEANRLARWPFWRS